MSNWKRVAILSVTGTEVDGTWTVESLRCPSFTAGVGAGFVVPTQTDGMTWTYAGEQLLALMRWHTHLIFQHVPPPKFLDDLRNSKDSHIEEIAFWIDYEATVAAGYWSKYQQPLEIIQRGFTLKVQNINRFKNTLVDPYEGYGNMADVDDWKKRESKHCWFMDLNNAQYPLHFAQKVAELVLGYPGVRVFTDNCYGWQYPGTATNVTQTFMLNRGAAFIVGMQTYLSMLRKYGLGTWGNCGALEHNYPQLDLKMGELDLVNASHAGTAEYLLSQSVDKGEEARRGLRQMYVAHCENRGYGVRWSRDATLWTDLAERLDSVYDDNIGVVCARSGRYLMAPSPCL